MRKLLPIVLTLCTAAALPLASHAETVLLTFSGTASGSLSFDSTQFTLSSGEYQYSASSVITDHSGGIVNSFYFSQTPGDNAPDFYVSANGGYVEEYYYGPALAGDGSDPVFTPGVYDFTGLDLYLDGGHYSSATGEIVTISDVTATPEPSSLLLLATGLAGVGGAIRRRIQQS